ncbi:hypothetical protein WJX74_008140 [Apatococcus lobatus]|uniref:PsbP C-terminal domain-containing protein n=1 Tax=Apatococcus lobatus TaxID=904363 RepID=A0AAW1QN80_9CHLO
MQALSQTIQIGPDQVAPQVLRRPGFCPTRQGGCKRQATVCQSASSAGRRQVLEAAAVLAAGSLLPQAASAKGYVPAKDQQDGYSFIYPFGWQEVSVSGQDVVYKDIIEPLESASVAVTPSDKKSVEEYGGLGEVAKTFSEEVLTPKGQPVKVLGVNKRAADSGRVYYEFEFASKAPNYIRHALSAVTVANGKLYTLTTGANENRWPKVKADASAIIKSFNVDDVVKT